MSSVVSALTHFRSDSTKRGVPLFAPAQTCKEVNGHAQTPLIHPDPLLGPCRRCRFQSTRTDDPATKHDAIRGDDG